MKQLKKKINFLKIREQGRLVGELGYTNVAEYEND
jgi:hypothetical protein